MSLPSPAVGRIVHYVSHGTPVLADGTQEYASQCRAAIITAVHASRGEGTLANMNGPEEISLAVFNPTGMFFNERCRHSEGTQSGGTWHWPERV
ncbi:hypothetical protein ACFCY9_12520 [Streptomyces fimicarius]|uniref:hypothetical protein n=1 Tax=Streptomyces griseus TaxID=1911 RepID=UPI0035D86B7A